LYPTAAVILICLNVGMLACHLANLHCDPHNPYAFDLIYRLSVQY
jgi:hypothetical protein